jgi:hypothetical protein
MLDGAFAPDAKEARQARPVLFPFFPQERFDGYREL